MRGQVPAHKLQLLRSRLVWYVHLVQDAQPHWAPRDARDGTEVQVAAGTHAPAM